MLKLGTGIESEKLYRATPIFIILDTYLAGFVITLSPNRPFASNSLFSAKNYLHSSYYKN